ncbi:MAG: phospholipase D-like domain-containing protein, partial [Chloroflexota bacterium]|nr:phospholipase D-like domain-containing protein [Chloroflexota bacterium]
GLFLSFAITSENRTRPVARSALGLGFGFGVVLLPMMVLVALQAMYNAGGTSPAGFILSMGVVGALFGFVSGIMTGTLPRKSNYWHVTWVVTLAFGIGGLAFGFGLWNYFYALYETGVGTAQLLFAFFVFGAVGGLVLGWIFSRDQEKAAPLDDDDQAPIQARFFKKRGFWGTVLFAIGIYLLARLIAFSPLNFSGNHLSDYLPSDSIGVHWSDPWVVTETDSTVGQSGVAQTGNLIAITWLEDGGAGSDVFYTSAPHVDDELTVWRLPTNVSESQRTNSTEPQIAIDSAGRNHIVWTEALAGEAGDSAIFYRTCLDGECGESVTLSNPEAAACGGDLNITPAIAINADDTVMVAWNSGADNLAFLSWEADSAPPDSQSCALAKWSAAATNPRLAAHPDGEFALVFDDGVEIFIAFTDAAAFSVTYQESGRSPEIFIDRHGVVHATWCGIDGQVKYRADETVTKTIPSPACLNRPALGQDADGLIHVLWHANQAELPSGAVVDSNLIYESRLVSDAWTTPTIVNLSAPSAQPAISTSEDGTLHLVWDGFQEGAGRVSYANFRVYECSQADLNEQGQLALTVAQSGDYRPTDDLVPFCHNQFDSLLILPKADPAYSDNPPTLNGAFDDVSALIQSARYEVLLSTMWYETDDTGTSPGVVLAEGVKKLYDQVKANPDQYPRGMTVRILLDNPPEFALSRLVTQVWNVFQHMRYAGLTIMDDPEIGWKVEVANYSGSLPHGHTKIVIIDGKTAVAAGFNFQHKHQSKDHPSGKGKDDYDLGLQMTGPVAQVTQLSFDDLWSGSNRITCPDLDSDSSLWWITCEREFATAEHVPEVKKYYLAESNANAFALHRTEKFNESDVTVPKTVSSAQETLDVLQVNFTLKMICDLNLLFEVCDFRDALSYMQAMMDAIETNQVKTRVLIKSGPIEGVESNIAIAAFRDALEERGLGHLVEFRYFNDSVHAKAVLIDNQFLLVGSQNFHYSAFGDSALTEFNIGTDDPDAIASFQRFFEYHWDRGDPILFEE